MTAYEFGTIGGSVIGFMLFASLFYGIVSKLFKPEAADRFLPAILIFTYVFVVAAAYVGDDGFNSSLLYPGIGDLIGAILFTIGLNKRRPVSQVKSKVAVAVSVCAVLYLFVAGPANKGSLTSSAAHGCVKAFEKSFDLKLSYTTSKEYCTCVVEPMVDECSDWTLVFSKDKVEQCMGELSNSRQSTADGIAKTQSIQDFCVSQHLGSRASDFYARYVDSYRATAIKMLMDESPSEMAPMAKKRLENIYECGVDRLIEECPIKTAAGYSSCLFAETDAVKIAATRAFEECSESKQAH